MKWIIGYVDSYGKVHHKVIRENDEKDSHNQFWSMAHHGKWRWIPSNPKHLNTYSEELDEESLDRIWGIIDEARNIYSK